MKKGKKMIGTFKTSHKFINTLLVVKDKTDFEVVFLG